MPIPCDCLLINAQVVTMDERYSVHARGSVAIGGGSILAIGDIAAEYEPKQTIDCAGRVVMPGLINAHTHVAMAMLRGLADDLRLDVWLLGYMMPVERQFVRPDFVALGTNLGCAEMIRSGTTCFADMYYFEEVVAETAAAAGLRAVCAQTVLKFPAPDAASFEDSLARAREFITRWKGHSRIVPAVAPHAPYTCTAEILGACAKLASEFAVPLHIHLAETTLEVEQSRREHGMPVVPWVRKQGLFDARVIAAHCVHIDEEEMRTLKESGGGVAHNPTSNLKLGSGVAPVAKMLELGLAVGIGTDGPASNNDLDMFEEMRLAALLAKGIGKDPTALPARDALAMATRLGAQAIDLGEITGSLEPGKRADLIVVDLDQAHHVPRFGRDPGAVYSDLVYACKASDVVDVMCDGRWLMRDRVLLTVDEDTLRGTAESMARRIDLFLIEREQSVLQKLIAIGGAAELESFEIQVKAKLASPDGVVLALGGDEITVIRSVHYHQYDTYFFFADPTQGSLRYREDEFLDNDKNVVSARSRLTLTGPSREAAFGSVLLFRSRFFAPATHSPRFYREYFRPAREREVEKYRRRFQVAFRGARFWVHIDQMVNPHAGVYFLEVKSRTWSRRDAQDKAAMITELLQLLGARPDETIEEGYVAL
jgi:5-methylthioadenosine/S-adenosylhomocysteine deaminase